MAGGEDEEDVVVERAPRMQTHGGVERPALVDQIDRPTEEAGLVGDADRQDDQHVPDERVSGSRRAAGHETLGRMSQAVLCIVSRSSPLARERGLTGPG